MGIWDYGKGGGHGETGESNRGDRRDPKEAAISHPARPGLELR